MDEKVWNQYRNNYPAIVSHLIINYRKHEMVDEARDLLTTWLERNPKDKEAQKLLRDLLTTWLEHSPKDKEAQKLLKEMEERG